MDEKIAIENLREIKEIFDRHGIEFWLDCGTLLGIVRNGHLIPWDNDIDLGIWKKEVEKFSSGKEAYSDLQKKGFDIYFLEDKIVLEKDGVPINAAIFYISGEKALRSKYLLYGKNPVGKFLRKLWWLFSVSYSGRAFRTKKTFLVKFVQTIFPYSLRRFFAGFLANLSKNFGCREIVWEIPAYFFKNLSELEFSGMRFKVPSSTEKYLELHYGKEWKIPQEKWDTIMQDAAVKKPE